MRPRGRRLLVALAAAVAVAVPLTASWSAGSAASAAPAKPALHPVVITLWQQANLGPGLRRGPQKARREQVLRTLQDTARTAQAPLLDALADLAQDGSVAQVRPFWISDVVAARATDAAVATLRSRPEVRSVTPETVFTAGLTSTTGAAPADTVEPNLTQVGAPQTWPDGADGRGVVVALLDTGVDLDHPDLVSSWRGGSNSWFDPYGEHPAGPVDLNGHGTWVAGVVGGGSAGGSAIGMAPAAQWIAARVFDDHDTGTTSGIRAALQWAVDPDRNPATDDGADVVNGSWSYSTPGCHLDFQPDLAALRSLDVLPVFAAGNGGPAISTSFSPANYPEALSVGAVDGQDAALAMSSRGPSTCGGRARPFPDLVAPGADIRTSDLFGTWTRATGTSMSAPHVSGALALLLSGRPGLTADTQLTLLDDAALDLGDLGPDDTYGAGRLDVGRAWSSVVAADPGGPATTGVDAAPDPVTPGAPVTVTAQVSDTGSGGAAVVAAEAFVDSVGPDGSGVPLPLSSAGRTTTTATGPVSGSWADGLRTVAVHARDATGRWGAASTTTFLVDGSPPIVSAAGASPDPSAGATTLTVSATATDAGGVAGLRVTEEGLRVPALDTALASVDGNFGGSTETGSAQISLAGWSAGQHLLQVRATDVAGHVSAARTVSVTVLPADGVFADGFESGGLGAWTGSAGGSRLAVGAAGAMVGLTGLRATVDAGGQSYVEDTRPASETRYRARFWFDGGRASGDKEHDVLVGLNGAGKPAFELRYRLTSTGTMQLRAGASTGSGTRWSAWTPLGAGAHPVELAWSAGSAGRLDLVVDGSTTVSTGAVSNGTWRVDTVRLGPTEGLTSKSKGVQVFDAFASSRGSELHP